jgi:vancomycin resistance protein YoaR
MPWPTLSRWFILAFVLLAAGAGARQLEHRLAPPDLPGLMVDGVVVPPGVSPGAFVAARAGARLRRRTRLVLEGQDVAGLGTGLDAPDHAVSLGELGVTIDEASVVRRIELERREGTWYDRVERAAKAARGGIDVPLDVRIDERVARPIVERIKDWTDRSPVSARLDLDRHEVKGEKAGLYVDTDAALAALARLAATAGADATVGEVVIPTRTFPAHVSRAFVEKVDVRTVVSEYSTGFSRAGDQSRRGKNIDVAASKLDGLVLAPGELVSFNSVVGERSEDNGFQKSWEIFKGEMVEGVGGGTCQVASTFYAAVLFGGLEVTERLPHSRPSAYIPLGLDATVVYPIVDLKVRNPYDFPVVVHASVKGNQLTMQLLGERKPARVTFVREIVDAYAYPRKVSVESKLRASRRVVLKQHGIRGYKIKRTRTLLFKDGTRKKEENTDLYPATAEIYEVPPEFDVSLLPPLPADDVDERDGGDAEPAPAEAAPAVPPAATAAASPPAPPPAPPAAPPAATPAATPPATPPAGDPLVVTEGPGAHAPTAAQAKPPKTLTLSR